MYCKFENIYSVDYPFARLLTYMDILPIEICAEILTYLDTPPYGDHVAALSLVSTSSRLSLLRNPALFTKIRAGAAHARVIRELRKALRDEHARICLTTRVCVRKMCGVCIQRAPRSVW